MVRTGLIGLGRSLPGALGGVERRIGLTKEDVTVLRGCARPRDTDCSRHTGDVAMSVHDDLKFVQEAPHLPIKSYAIETGRHHDRELVAPQPSWETTVIAERAQPIGDTAQHRVACCMAEDVVDAFEAVEVDQKHGHVVVRSARLVQPSIENTVKFGPVGQLGQVVDASEVAQALLQAVPFGDVLDQTDEGNGFALGQLDLAGVPHAPRVAFGGYEIAVHLERLARVQRAPDRGDEEGAIGLGEIVHDLAVRHTGADGPFVDGEDTV